MSVYKITSPSTDLVYYGSTIQLLKRRFWNHKNNMTCSSKQILKFGDAKIELLEIVEDIDQLKSRERFYIENYPCVNIQIPERTKQEWTENNKQQVQEYQKEYQKDYQKKYYELNKQKITCACGSIVLKIHMSRHQKTDKHQAHLNS